MGQSESTPSEASPTQQVNASTNIASTSGTTIAATNSSIESAAKSASQPPSSSSPPHEKQPLLSHQHDEEIVIPSPTTSQPISIPTPVTNAAPKSAPTTPDSTPITPPVPTGSPEPPQVIDIASIGGGGGDDAATTSTVPITAAKSSSASLPSVRRTGGPVGVGESHLDLWYSLVEWAAADLRDGVVLAWDSEEVGHRVLSVSSSQSLIQQLQLKQAERKKARAEATRKRKEQEELKKRMEERKNDAFIPIELQPLKQEESDEKHHPVEAPSNETTSASSSSSPSFPIPYTLASSLLSFDRTLASLRHSYVPSRVGEDTFWTEYFTMLKQQIQEHVLSLQQPQEQLQDTNPHLHGAQHSA